MSFRPTLHHLRYFISDAWDEWRHSPWINVLALGTLISVLFLAGVIMLLLFNVTLRVEKLRADIRVEVYLWDGITNVQRLELHRRIEAIDGVERVNYVSRSEALYRYRSFNSEMAGLIDELDTNPLPASFEVFLRQATATEQRAEQLVAELTGGVGIDSVRFDRDLLHGLEDLLEMARLGGVALALVAFGTVIFVIAGVLRLTVYARRDEIDIMLLVGATPGFVRGPFLVAGLGQGLCAALLALGLVEGLRRLINLQAAGPDVLRDLFVGRMLPLQPSLALLFVGLLVSFFGSYFAARSRT
jgi:cell division transport system permease protein